MNVGEMPAGDTCSLVLKAEHMRVASGAYSVTLTPTYCIFENVSGGGLRYYIGVEPRFSFWGNP